MNNEYSFTTEIITDKVEVTSASKIVDKNLFVHQVAVKVRITEGMGERLFYKCWGEFGDDVVRKWLEAEGFTMTKI